jgi:lysophospholipase L1-like esterase
VTANPAAAHAGKPKKRRRSAFVVTALLLGLVVASLLVEAAFRMFWTLPPWFAEFQQAGMYVAVAGSETALQPGYRGTLRVGADGTTQVSINALGLRGPEIGTKQTGEKRLLVVGDSLVFGYGVEAESALPARLEAALSAQGARVTVGNGGVPGFGSRHAIGHMARLDAPFAADAFVFCGFLGNDASDDTSPRRTVYAGLMLQGAMASLVGTSWRTRLALKSRAALWVEAWILSNRPHWSPLAGWTPDPAEQALAAGLPPDGQRHAGLFLDVIDERHAWTEGAEPVLPRLTGILTGSLRCGRDAAAGRPFVFVVLPTLWQVDEERRVQRLRELGFDPAIYERGLAQKRWLEAAAAAGVRAFDATPILAADPEPATLFIADGGHFTTRGNELVARWLAKELAPLLR